MQQERRTDSRGSGPERVRFTRVCLSQPPGAGNQCLEIDGHDSYPLSPLGVWSCGGEFQQANEWWKLEPIMGHLLSMQSGGQPGEPSPLHPLRLVTPGRRTLTVESGRRRRVSVTGSPEGG